MDLVSDFKERKAKSIALVQTIRELVRAWAYDGPNLATYTLQKKAEKLAQELGES